MKTIRKWIIPFVLGILVGMASRVLAIILFLAQVNLLR